LPTVGVGRVFSNAAPSSLFLRVDSTQAAFSERVKRRAPWVGASRGDLATGGARRGEATLTANFGGLVQMVKLTLREKETIQDAVRRFRKLVERSGIKKEMRRRENYEKPSETKRRARLRAERRAVRASKMAAR
jgi:small subunit ribosomal protein S21